MDHRAGPWLALSVAAVLALGGCGADERTPAPPNPPGGERWEGIVVGLPDRADPESTNVCGRGEADCVENVVAEMQRRLEPLAEACDHNAPFALMYLRVTEGVEGPDAPAFEDRSYLNHLDAHFAILYFEAFDAWRAGRRDEVPEAWRLAFESAEQKLLTALGDMLLGMNAHISRDLPFALETIGLRTTDGRSARPDYDLVNTLLEDTQDAMLSEQAELFDPSVTATTMPALDVGGGTFAELMGRWRTEAFDNGRRLIEARTEGERQEVADEIEEGAAARGRLIEAVTSNRIVGPSAEERARHCEASRGE